MVDLIIYALTDPRSGEVKYVGKSHSGMTRTRSHRGIGTATRPRPG